MSDPFSAVDIQAAVIPLLQSFPALTEAQGTTPALFTGQVLDDDPLAADGEGDIKIALHLLGEGDMDVSLGGADNGTRTYCSYFALLVYVGEANKSPVAKRTLSAVSRVAREALMQKAVRQDQSAQRLWYKNQFKKPVATLYQNGGAFRRSITFVQFLSRIRTTS